MTSVALANGSRRTARNKLTRSATSVAYDECADFLIAGVTGVWQGIRQAQEAVAVRKTAKCQFTDDERLGKDLSGFQQDARCFIGLAKVVYPERSFDENHSTFVRPRGAADALGSLPPRRAS